MEMMTGTYIDNRKDEAIGFEFKTNLSSSEKVGFVIATVNMLFQTDKSGEKIYLSVIKDMIFDYAIIKYFTNIDLSFIDDSDSMLGDIEEFINNTNAAEIVKVNADVDVIEGLARSVSDNIMYRTGIRPDDIYRSLSELVNNIAKKVDSIDIEQMMKMADTINNAKDDFTPDGIAHAYYNSKLYK